MIVDFQHVKPGKGAAFVRTKLKNLRNNNIQEMTFRGEEKIEEAYIEEKKLQYQYASSGMFHFMDQENYEDVSISEDSIADKAKFLKDNIEVTAYYYKDEVLFVNLPNFVEYKITSTEPGIKGDTAKSGTKPATIDSGTQINVPLFVNEGDVIKVDTRTGGYVERVAQ
ncbi:MAG: elongation factor P [Candidatus Omnitrophica bacterium]|nr:elongation factor P [Candidatus Omnitrophota bacterium]